MANFAHKCKCGHTIGMHGDTGTACTATSAKKDGRSKTKYVETGPCSCQKFESRKVKKSVV